MVTPHEPVGLVVDGGRREVQLLTCAVVHATSSGPMPARLPAGQRRRRHGGLVDVDDAATALCADPACHERAVVTVSRSARSRPVGVCDRHAHVAALQAERYGVPLLLTAWPPPQGSHGVPA